MSHEFIVGVPRCNEPAGLFAETIAAIAASSARPKAIIIIDNGDEALDPGAIDDRVSSAIAVHLVHAGRNIGCAGAWNAIHVRPVMPDITTIIVNADCAVTPDTFERMLDVPGPAIVCGLGFGCFRLDAEIYTRVGPFDEAFYPVYWEDTDYRYRLKLAGVPIIEWPVIEAERLDATQFGRARYSTGIAHGWRHEDGRGYQGWTGEKLAWFYECWNKNRDRYAAKWGGTVGEETFTEPFGGKKDEG